MASAFDLSDSGSERPALPEDLDLFDVEDDQHERDHLGGPSAEPAPRPEVPDAAEALRQVVNKEFIQRRGDMVARADKNTTAAAGMLGQLGQPKQLSAKPLASHQSAGADAVDRQMAEAEPRTSDRQGTTDRCWTPRSWSRQRRWKRSPLPGSAP